MVPCKACGRITDNGRLCCKCLNKVKNIKYKHKLTIEELIPMIINANKENISVTHYYVRNKIKTIFEERN